MSVRPACIACQYDSLGYPCRKADGTLDFAKLATAYLAYGRCFGDTAAGDPDQSPDAWSGDCVFEIEQEHPDHLFRFVIAAADACATVEDVAYLAAGAVENMIVQHGPYVIDRIERLATTSAKFTYLLSGVWGGSRTDPEVWARVGKAVGLTARIDGDGRGPWDGKPVTVLSHSDAEALLKSESVTAIAKALDLI